MNKRSTHCTVSGVDYVAISHKCNDILSDSVELCQGCAGEHDEELCRGLGDCFEDPSTPENLIIWKKL